MPADAVQSAVYGRDSHRLVARENSIWTVLPEVKGLLIKVPKTTVQVVPNIPNPVLVG